MTRRFHAFFSPHGRQRNPLGPSAGWRVTVVRLVPIIGLCALIGRIVWLQVLDHAFLQEQGDSRTIRIEPISANRGVIMDREGEPLAVSTPVLTLIGNPRDMSDDRDDLVALAKALEEPSVDAFVNRITELQRRNKSFVYLARRITADRAQRVLALQQPGIESRNEYKRYYPAGEVTSQLVGITDINDEGIEGMERAYNEALRGVPGERKVLKDRRGHWVRDLHILKDASPGHDIQLSISLRLQYLAYRELLNTVQAHSADAGSILIMNARTGEVLAEASVPSYNPNHISTGVERNRPLTDAMEPGSVMKPLAMTAILESGHFSPDMVLDTSPGYMRVDNFTIRDVRNFGKLTLTGVITKSSNIGMTQLALALPNDTLWQMYNRMGLSHSPGTGFPGESAGLLPAPTLWSKSKRATLAYGYGLAVSPLQLASAYTTIANDGRHLQPSLMKLSAVPQGEALISPKTAHHVLEMMETVVGPYGGASQAAIEGYRVAGKTGTVRKTKAGSGGYETHAYRSNFVGIVPATNPSLIVVISIDNSKLGGYYGGLVAAPLFSRIAGPALRMLDVPPDDKRRDGDDGRHAEDAVKVTGIRQQGAAEAAARATPND